MEQEQVVAKIKIFCRDTEREVDAVFDTGAGSSYMSPDIAIEFPQCIQFLSKAIETETAERNADLVADKYIATEIEFDNVDKPAIFLVPNRMKPGLIIIGRPELDRFNVQFTPNGPKSIKSPLRDTLL
jgi:hypothetical protein